MNESREGYFTSSTSPFDFTEDVDEEEIIADEVTMGGRYLSPYYCYNHVGK